MSQEKVDRYKAEKANRKEILKKEKRNRMLARTAGVFAAAALVCWAGYSVWMSYENKAESVEVETSALDDYLNEISLQTE